MVLLLPLAQACNGDADPATPPSRPATRQGLDTPTRQGLDTPTRQGLDTPVDPFQALPELPEEPGVAPSIRQGETEPRHGQIPDPSATRQDVNPQVVPAVTLPELPQPPAVAPSVRQGQAEPWQRQIPNPSATRQAVNPQAVPAVVLPALPQAPAVAPSVRQGQAEPRQRQIPNPSATRQAVNPQVVPAVVLPELPQAPGEAPSIRQGQAEPRQRQIPDPSATRQAVNPQVVPADTLPELPQAHGVDPSIRQAHAEARQRLTQNLAALRPYDVRFGRVNPLADYRKGTEELRHVAGFARAQHGYKVNHGYLVADPYLHYHNHADVDSLIPGQVSDQEFATLRQTLLNVADWAMAVRLNLVFTRIDSTNETTRQTTRKRIKRLVNEMLDRCARGEASRYGLPSQMHDLAFQLDESTAQTLRCIDGIRSGLTVIEAGAFGTGGPAQHLGHCISSVLTDYRMDFVQRHADLVYDPEWSFMVTDTMKQTMLYSLGLRGRPAEMAYPDATGPFQPHLVMNRFLLGERNVSLGAALTPRPVNFEAYTVDKMVELLQAAWAKANRQGEPYAGTEASRLTSMLINQELINGDGTAREPVLGEQFLDFVNDMQQGNAYFQPAEDPSNPGYYRLTQVFWLHLLEKYGYIIPA